VCIFAVNAAIGARSARRKVQSDPGFFTPAFGLQPMTLRSRYLRRWFALPVIFAAGIWWYASQRASAPVDIGTLSASDWREDLRALATGLAKRHANAFHRVSESQFDSMVTLTDSLIPHLRPWEVLIHFSELAAVVGDAHTYVALPTTQHFYPVEVYYFGSDARVVRATPEYKDLIGLRLVAIGGHPLTQVQDQLDRILTHGENTSFFLAHYPWFLSHEVLTALHVIRDSVPTRFTFRGDDGSFVNRELSPLDKDPEKWERPYSHPPLFVQHADDEFWYDTLPRGDAVYVVFNSYAHLSAHAASLFAFLDAHPARRLIIDLRNNSGGDYQEGYKELIRPLTARPTINAPGHLYVITGRYTFSAAMNNAAQFRTATHATLVGEPPGEVPNSYQERRSFRLPHSHLLVNYSSAYYRFLPTDQPALVPDHLAAPDWNSYQAGVDPALTWILSDSTHPRL